MKIEFEVNKINMECIKWICQRIDKIQGEIVAEIVEAGGSLADEPTCTYEHDFSFEYKTCTRKGNYYFDFVRNKIEFKGFRNSFLGGTLYFAFQPDDTTDTKGPWTLAFFLPELVEIRNLRCVKFCTSAPNYPLF